LSGRDDALALVAVFLVAYDTIFPQFQVALRLAIGIRSSEQQATPLVQLGQQPALHETRLPLTGSGCLSAHTAILSQCMSVDRTLREIHFALSFLLS